MLGYVLERGNQLPERYFTIFDETESRTTNVDRDGNTHFFKVKDIMFHLDAGHWIHEVFLPADAVINHGVYGSKADKVILGDQMTLINSATFAMLIEAGADVNTRRRTDDRTPLQIAELNNNREVIRLLLEAGSKETEKPKPWGGFVIVGERRVSGGELVMWHIAASSGLNRETFRHEIHLAVSKMERDEPREHWATLPTNRCVVTGSEYPWKNKIPNMAYPEPGLEVVNELIQADKTKFQRLNDLNKDEE